MFSIASSRGATVVPLVRSAGHVGRPRAHARSRWPALLHHCILGLSLSFAERAVVALPLMRPSLPGPPCYFVVAARSPSTVGCASLSRTRYNSAAQRDAREASQLSLSSQSRAPG